MEKPTYKSEAELAVLYEISQTLSEFRTPEESLKNVLNILSVKLGMKRGMVTLLGKKSQKIQVTVAHGLSELEKERGQYRIGEGVIGKVFDTGEAATISSIGSEPKFLDKTGARKDLETDNISFICVPIKSEECVIGTLSADIPFKTKTFLEDNLCLLSVISSMIARTLEKQSEIEREKGEILKKNEELISQLKEIHRPEHIIGNSKAMAEIYRLIEQVAKSNATVVIYGESGTGKEVVASAIHYSSNKIQKTFIKVNCAALPETLIESELFGHEQGAFTGATSQKIGRFERANGGTIFLDEIGELSKSMQTKLLRVLQEKEIERVGGTKTVKVSARVITATNKNLEEEVRTGNFREDLYYRLCVFPIHIPPLRERGADIILLAEHFLEKYSKENNKNIKRICSPAIDMLLAYHWPGNVRELENCIERAVLLSETDTIHAYHLPPTLQMEEGCKTKQRGTLKTLVENFEKEIIQEVLKRCDGNQTHAAKELGTTFRILNYKVQQYKINPYKHVTKIQKDKK